MDALTYRDKRRSAIRPAKIEEFTNYDVLNHVHELVNSTNLASPGNLHTIRLINPSNNITNTNWIIRFELWCEDYNIVHDKYGDHAIQLLLIESGIIAQFTTYLLLERDIYCRPLFHGIHVDGNRRLLMSLGIGY